MWKSVYLSGICSSKHGALYKIIIFISLFLVFGPDSIRAQNKPYFNEIAAFKEQDKKSFPAKHAILFTGSSSFRMWNNIQEDFPGYTILNRGFGGSTLQDVIYYAKDIILPYQPKQLVIYCGENDLASSDTVTAEMVINRFRYLFTLVRKMYPGISVVFVSIKPSPSRERLLSRVKEANAGIRKFLAKQPNTSFADVFHKMIGKDGQINTGLFLEDNLHMNKSGYAIWQSTIKPFLLKD